MISIWKYEIEPDFINQEVEMQEGAQIISFGLDGANRLCFWALVDTDARIEKRLMACVGTGWPVDFMFGADEKQEVSYIGTVTHGVYVWHLFDMGVVPAQKFFEVATQSSIKEADAQC